MIKSIDAMLAFQSDGSFVGFLLRTVIVTSLMLLAWGLIMAVWL